MAIVERWMWNDDQDNVTKYGVGLALRLRGGGDYDMSNLLAESRVFVARDVDAGGWAERGDRPHDGATVRRATADRSRS